MEKTTKKRKPLSENAIESLVALLYCIKCEEELEFTHWIDYEKNTVKENAHCDGCGKAYPPIYYILN